MASHSPILLSSSPQISFRSPPTTPQSHRKIVNCASSSSPGLVDLPTFAKLPVNKLKSGSNAQKLPASATSGFTSAASFLKSQHFQANGQEKGRSLDERIDDEHGERAVDKGAGKGTKSRKSGKSGQHAPLLEVPAQLRDELGPVKVIDENKASRGTSIAPSDFNYPPEDHIDPAAPQVAQSKPFKAEKRPGKNESSVEGSAAKKPRKRATKTAKGPTTQAKRRFTKSESIILNSDDPDPVNNGQPGMVLESVTTANAIAANESPIQHTAIMTDLASARLAPMDRPSLGNVSGAVSRETEEQLKEKSRSFGSHPLQDVNAVSPVVPRSNQAAAVSPHFTAAPRRRMSWTPVRDTDLRKEPLDERPGTASSTESEVASKSLATVISGFEYTGQDATSMYRGRTSTGEALTKKRRIEPLDGPAPGPMKPKKAKTKTAKKPQTITALATKAYQAETDPSPAQPTVSEFFSAAEPITPQIAPDGASNCGGVKVKKPRKSRAKKTDGDPAKSGSKKPPKTTKGKGKQKEVEAPIVLFAPDMARAQEQSQDIMFGTSSQLLLEESPTFIRDIQAAIHDSERVTPLTLADRDWQNRTRERALRTGVSLHQARKDHWSSAARDEGGSILDLDSTWDRVPRRCGALNDITDLALAINGPEAGEATDLALPKPAPLSPHVSVAGGGKEGLDIGAEPKQQSHGRSPSTIVECCRPLHEAESESVLVKCMPTEPEAAALPSTYAEDEFLLLSPSPEPPHEEYFMPISSDHVVPELAQVNNSTAQVHEVSKPPMLLRSSTSPMINRTVLQSLDANAGLLRHTPSIKNADFNQQRALTTVSPTSQAKRPRGRPRKDEIRTPAAVSPRRRGRPPKALKGPTLALVSATQASPRRRKNTGVSKSSPEKTNDWVNIDEISDPESPNTPSPPRRRASSSPPAVEPLELSPTKTNPLPPTGKTSTLKSTDASFAAIQATLFPRITDTIKSTPPSNDMQNPTWHEKILLYDPIVLEDITAWLNGQGVRIETQRLKAKPKSNARKKKGVVEEEPEFETVEEELKPWMVQKWCEEKSVCCLWKEGLRGGVKNRY